METLQRDLIAPMTQKSTKGMSLLEIVGYDTDSSYEKLMQLTISNDKNHISVGGQTVTSNQQFQIRLPEEGSIQDLLSLGITGQLTLSNTAAFIFNIPSLFKGLYVKFGSKQYAFSDQDVYQQLSLALSNKAEIEPYSDAIWMDMNNYDAMYNLPNTDPAATPVFATAHGYTNMLPFMAKRTKQRLGYNTYAGPSPSTGFPSNSGPQTGDNNFFIPLWMIFPMLKSIDQNALFTGLGQTIEFSIQSQTDSYCVFDSLGSGAQYTYAINNISVVHQYAHLDPQRQELVRKSEVIWHPIKQMQYRNQPLATVSNLNFSVSRGDKMHRLIFAFCSANQSPQQSVTNVDTTTNIFGLSNQLTSPILYFPKLRIYQCEIDAGGDRVVINSPQIGCLQTFQNTQGIIGMEPFYTGGLYQGFMKDLRCAYSVDLQRFPLDYVGTTAAGQVQVLVKVILQIDRSLVVCNTLEITSAGATIVSNGLSNFVLYAYIETSDTMTLKNGLYQ